jgi:hypothetical protein
MIAEGFVLYYCYRRGYVFLQSWAGLTILAHLFFLVVPKFSMVLAIFGGVAGEFVLPVLLLVVMIEMPGLRSNRALALFAIASLAFWRAIINWWMTFFGQRSIPYPRDGTGGFSVFQSPFDTLDGSPVGDMDKLIKIYGWTEELLIQSYAALGAGCLIAFCALWYWGIQQESVAAPLSSEAI